MQRFVSFKTINKIILIANKKGNLTKEFSSDPSKVNVIPWTRGWALFLSLLGNSPSNPFI